MVLQVAVAMLDATDVATSRFTASVGPLGGTEVTGSRGARYASCLCDLTNLDLRLVGLPALDPDRRVIVHSGAGGRSALAAAAPGDTT